MNFKSIVKQITPPFIIDLLQSKKNDLNHSNQKGEAIYWQGNYENWIEAGSYANGYSDKIILEKVKSSLLKVKHGEAVYERDSVLFDKIYYSWPILACLENIALENNNALHLIDFGGSLGSSYFQNRHFLKNLTSLKWIVVEQKHFVDCGKEDFEDAFLKFEYSIEDVLKKQTIHCLLLSGVLQYLPDPFKWIDKLCSYNIQFIILDRTGFINSEEKILTIQNVPEQIYQASYPCWFFNEEELIKRFSFKYDVIVDFKDSFTDPILVNEHPGYWKGFYLNKK